MIDAVKEFDPNLGHIFENKVVSNSDKPLVSITGSGKETFKTFNVSTAAAIVAATCGVNVIKPGSRSTSAYSGSVDVLNQLDIHISSTVDEAEELLENIGLCFMDFKDLAETYAIRYDNLFHHFHPLSYILPVLYIPFKTDGIVYGIADKDVQHSISILNEFDYKNTIVVSGAFKGNEEKTIDEYNPFGITYMSNINYDGSKIKYEIHDESNRFSESVFDVIKHYNNHSTNSETLLNAISGNADEILVDLVSYNTALMLLSCGRVDTIDQGVVLAKESINTQKPIKKLNEYQNYCRKTKNFFREVVNG